jgi:hypothetical protein
VQPSPSPGRYAAAGGRATSRRCCWCRCHAGHAALVGSFPTWVTLTVAGLAMGMMIFIMASGLTLVFGLMAC